jgi:hypothetical protein
MGHKESFYEKNGFCWILGVFQVGIGINRIEDHKESFYGKWIWGFSNGYWIAQ